MRKLKNDYPASSKTLTLSGKIVDGAMSIFAHFLKAKSSLKQRRG